ncbi:MAG: hypothetical protein ABI868_03720 [Acidobacteriota bacterium]
MSKRSMIDGLMAAVAVTSVMSISVAAQQKPAAAAKPAVRRADSVPKTPWGDPNIAGVFTNNDESGIPIERPNQFEGKQLEDVSEGELQQLRDQRENQRVAAAPNLGGIPGTNPVHWFENFGAKNSRAWSLIDPADGRIPPTTDEARRRPVVRGGSSFGGGPFNSHEDFSLYDRCITRGIPGSMMPAIYGNAYEILQGPGWVGIRYEMIHEARIIPLDGRPHLGKGVQLDMGDPRGHWEGDTLVIETTNFTRRSAYRNANPDTFKLIERFKPVSPELVEWSVTINDPTTWTRPWTFAMNLTRGGAAQQPFEYACHEGNYGMENMLNAARKAERDAAK